LHFAGAAATLSANSSITLTSHMSAAAKPIAVAGYGAVGRALVARLAARGDQVRVVQRVEPGSMPQGATFVSCDIGDTKAAAQAFQGAGTVVCAVGLPYRSAVFTQIWPLVMRNMLEASARTEARFVFADNLYMYGPQTATLREDMPLTGYGAKPRARAEITKLWQEAHAAGRARACAVRASDFYGPDVPTSVVSTMGVQRLLAGKAALAPYPADHPHAQTYVPDFARALATLIDAPDDAYGEAWHVPNAPERSLREVFELAADLIGVRRRVTVLPQALLPLLGLFSGDIRELREMRFQWDRPYLVETAKFARRFWGDATPLDEGLRATISFYRNVRSRG
jgi:nucleoside-diphosphate-sugar epimerase